MPAIWPRWPRSTPTRATISLQADICDAKAPRATPSKSFKPDWVMHLAAESHVDRSIDGPGEFIQTNLVGTYVMLQAALRLLARA